MWYLDNPCPCLSYWKQFSFRSNLSTCGTWIKLLPLFQAIQKDPKPVSALFLLSFTMLTKYILPATLIS